MILQYLIELSILIAVAIGIIFINSIVVFGIYAAFRYEWNYIDQKYDSKMIFGGIAKFLDDHKLPEFFKKPLYGCPVCMPTLYTPMVWFLFLSLPFDMTYFIVWIGTAGINWLIVKNLEV
jgi:hypothetical protein